MSKTLFVSLFAIVAVLVVMASSFSADAMPIKQQQQRPPKLARTFKFAPLRGSEACIDNITDAGEKVAAAVVEIFKAVADCPKPNNTANCIAIISTVAEDLTNAATFISQAVQACTNGGSNTQCITDLTQLASALADAARRVSAAVAACEHKEIGQCVEDVMDEVGDIETIVKSIRDAVGQCKK